VTPATAQLVQGDWGRPDAPLSLESAGGSSFRPMTALAQDERMPDADVPRGGFEQAGDEVEAARVEADEDNAEEVAAGRPAEEATDRQEAALLDLLRAQEEGR
jgi:hypothetical protein